ncbi:MULTISPECIES: UvrD-helicase domain-containing protein [Halomonadaceae]|uniref:UvrD-helicase domain-containing protein n=1 Tax=Halomonadaceae TaxID=28256 RepID=UPI003CEC016F
MGSFQPTAEQLAIIEYEGPLLVVRAKAGTGKSSVLCLYAERRPTLRMLYIAYNRSVREEAAQKFPSNVTCKTSHQLAFRAFGLALKHKLTANIRIREIADALDTRDWSLASDVQSALNRFMTSASMRLGPEHHPLKGETTESQQTRQTLVINCAEKVWARMIAADDNFPCSHDTYLKLYQLSGPDLSAQYDIIAIDEFQDTVPVLEDIVMKQKKCRVLMCGDSAQAIYQFRHAVDSLDSPLLQHATVMHLTNSFRFGPKVAEVANALLALKGEPVEVHGLGGADCVVPSSKFHLRHAPTGQVTFIARTMMGVLQAALFFASKKKVVYMVGGYDAYNLNALENLFWLSKGQKERVTDKKLLAEFSSFEQYRAMAEASDDPEMLRALKVIEAYPNLDVHLAQLKMQVANAEATADIVVTTAHRSKGLEWPTVYLLDDFMDIHDPKMSVAARSIEINLLYVASTRARSFLIANECITTTMKLAKKKGW